MPVHRKLHMASERFKVRKFKFFLKRIATKKYDRELFGRLFLSSKHISNSLYELDKVIYFGESKKRIIPSFSNLDL